MRAPVLCSSAVAVLLLSAGARADVAIPGHRVVPAEVVITGLRDFPGLRFVLAAVPLPSDSGMPRDLVPPTPVAVREGEPVAASTVFFQELRAIPLDAPEPVTDAWLAAAKAPASGTFLPHPRRVPEASDERAMRAHVHVRQVRAGFVSLEALPAEAVLADGSRRPLDRVVPHTFEVTSFQAPPGWRLFLMPDPAWPRAEPPPPAVPVAVGEVLPSAPGPRTLVAVQGAPGPDGSLTGAPHQAMGRWIDAWSRERLPLESPAVEARSQLEIEVRPGSRLGVTHGRRYRDARGRWFHDEGGTLPAEVPFRAWWAIAGGAAAALAAGAWALRRRRARA